MNTPIKDLRTHIKFFKICYSNDNEICVLDNKCTMVLLLQLCIIQIFADWVLDDFSGTRLGHTKELWLNKHF